MFIDQWRKRLAIFLLPLLASACEDGTEPSVPTSIEIGGDEASGAAGLVLTSTPTFLIRDQHGDPFGGVTVSIGVAGGGGTLASAALVSGEGPTPVGTWTLGAKAGLNELLLTVQGVEPVRIRATGLPGAPGKLAATTPQSFAGRVATAVDPLPRAILSDAFSNPLANVTVTVVASGGSAPATVTSAADGSVAIPQWVLGNTRGPQTLTLSAGPASVTFSVFARSGPPASISVAAGGEQAARAGTVLPQPVRVLVRDGFGNPADSVAVSFSILAGGGYLDAAAATTDAQGIATAPRWTTGLRVVPQRIRATVGSLSADVAASVATDYSIDVRFFGPAMSESRRAAFTAAAQRLTAIVVGDLPEVQTTGTEVSNACGATGVAPLTELIDDVVIFATIEPIDGPGKVLGSAGPCYVRTGGGPAVIGVMQFDDADIGSMESNGTFEGVIMHEMLHVLGIGVGSGWNQNLTGRGTTSVGFNGAAARNACIDIVGSRCNVSVPVEDTGGSGTADSHWRESVFNNELMTGFIDRGGMPLSLITVGALGDIGYVVNSSAADRYPGTIAAARIAGGRAAPSHDGWERTIAPAREISRSGRVTEVR